MNINNGRVKIVGSSINFTDRVLTTTNNIAYKAANSDLLPLDKTVPFVIKIDGVEIDSGDTYTVNYERGIITFDTALDRTGITFDGAYLLTSTFGMLEGISYETRVSTIDATFLNDEQEVFIKGKRSTTVTIDAFYSWDEELEEYFNSDQLFQLEVEENGNIKTFLGFFDQNTISVNNGEAVKTNLKFIGGQ